MNMNREQIVRALAGFFIMLSVAMAHFHHPYWLWFTAFVGFNLFQSAFTGFCPPEKLLARLGVKGCCE